MVLHLGFLIISVLQSTEALGWKWTKYEKWNCCPTANFKCISNPETINSNEIIQNIEINQICEHVRVCLIDLHDLNSQINYSSR
jgi:heterodisulfide reductase subunit B